MVLDAIAEKEEIQVGEQELIQYLVQSAQQYGMQPNDFIKAISENGQVPAFVGEVARRKALTIVLEAATVTDAKGKAVIERAMYNVKATGHVAKLRKELGV